MQNPLPRFNVPCELPGYYDPCRDCNYPSNCPYLPEEFKTPPAEGD